MQGQEGRRAPGEEATSVQTRTSTQQQGVAGEETNPTCDPGSHLLADDEDDAEDARAGPYQAHHPFLPVSMTKVRRLAL